MIFSLCIAGGKLSVLSGRGDALCCHLYFQCWRKESPRRHYSTAQGRKRKAVWQKPFFQMCLYCVRFAGLREGTQSHNCLWAQKSQAVPLEINVYVVNKVQELVQVPNPFRTDKQRSWSEPVFQWADACAVMNVNVLFRKTGKLSGPALALLWGIWLCKRL